MKFIFEQIFDGGFFFERKEYFLILAQTKISQKLIAHFKKKKKITTILSSFDANGIAYSTITVFINF